MKTKIIPAVLGIGLVLAACSTSPVVMDKGEKLTAAQAEVKADEGANGNVDVNLYVKHLAKPEELNTGANTYVVWAKNTRDAAAPVQNLGQLQVNENLEGRFSTVTPFKNFDLFITAEPIATVSYPSGYRALWTHVNE